MGSWLITTGSHLVAIRLPGKPIKSIFFEKRETNFPIFPRQISDFSLPIHPCRAYSMSRKIKKIVECRENRKKKPVLIDGLRDMGQCLDYGIGVSGVVDLNYPHNGNSKQTARKCGQAVSHWCPWQAALAGIGLHNSSCRCGYHILWRTCVIHHRYCTTVYIPTYWRRRFSTMPTGPQCFISSLKTSM